MEIEINAKEGLRKINIKYPSKKQTRMLWDTLRNLENSEKKQYIKNFQTFIDLRDKITLELCDINKEEFDNLPINEADKLTGFVGEATFGELDFTRLFKKPQQ